MARNEQPLSFIVTDDVIEYIKQLEVLVQYYRDRGHTQKGKGGISYWIKRAIKEQTEEFVKETEQKFGEEIGVKSIKIQRISDMKHPSNRSIVDDIIDEHLKGVKNE